MLRLRLFNKGDLTNQVDSRALDEGEITIGRDAKADWALDDPDRAVSRRHLTVANRGGLVTLRDFSSNGVFLGSAHTRIDRDRAIPIERGEAIHFGNYVLVLEEGQQASPERPDKPSTPFDQGDLSASDRPRIVRKQAQPFASAIKPDPLGDGSPIGDLDAWERRPDAAAGSWAPEAAHRRPDHSEMIGSERTWSAPPPPPAREAGYGFDAPFARPILEEPAKQPDAAAIPSDWLEGASASPEPVFAEPIVPAPAPLIAPVEQEDSPPILAQPARKEEDRRDTTVADRPDETGLFEHFCAGAGINAAAFATEDRAVVLERLGGVYRQAMLGVAELMQERTALRNEYRMMHTTVRPQGNNPFRWVPPQRLAVELLLSGDGGYTTGERALNDALHEIKAHLLCMLAGMRAALSTTFDALAPQQVEARVSERSYLLPMQRDAALWNEYVQLARALRAEADDSADGLINRAFRQAYEEQAAELGTNARRR